MEKLKPEIRCIYQEHNIYGIAYCSVSDIVDCPYLSKEKVNAEIYSAIYGGKSKTLEFRICEFKFEGELK